MQKGPAFFVSGVAFLVLLMAVLYYFDLLVVPLASIAAGFFFIGLAFPELVSKMKYSHTIWLPLAFSVAGILGIMAVFGDRGLTLLWDFGWCPREPCFPYAFYFISFFIGSASNWVAYFLNGEELNLLSGK